MNREKDSLSIDQQREIVSEQGLQLFSRQDISRFDDEFVNTLSVDGKGVLMVKYYPNKNNVHNNNSKVPSYGVMYSEEFTKDIMDPNFRGTVRVFEYNPIAGETRKLVEKVGLSELIILSSDEKKRVKAYLESLTSAYC